MPVELDPVGAVVPLLLLSVTLAFALTLVPVLLLLSLELTVVGFIGVGLIHLLNAADDRIFAVMMVPIILNLSLFTLRVAATVP